MQLLCIEIPAQSLFNISWIVTSVTQQSSIHQSHNPSSLASWKNTIKSGLKFVKQNWWIIESFNQSVYFVLIAFVFYLIVRKTSLILVHEKKTNYLICPTFWFEKNPSVCMSVFRVLTSCFATSVLPLPWSSLNLLVTEKFWKKESRKKCLIYISQWVLYLCGIERTLLSWK